MSEFENSDNTFVQNENSSATITAQPNITQDSIESSNTADFSAKSIKTARQISQDTVSEQDQKLLNALDEILEKHSKRVSAEQSIIAPQKTKNPSEKLKRKGVGFISLSMVLIFLGVMMLYALFSSKHDFMLVLKLSPISAILIGVEIFFAQIVTHGRFKINIPSIIVSALLTVSCCFMCTTLNDKLSAKNEEYNNRSVAAEIYDMSYQDLKYTADIEKLDVKVDLNPVGKAAKEGANYLSTGDIVDISIRLSGVIETPNEFARTSKEIINAYRIMGINVTNFYFSNESTLHTYSLNVEGRFAQDQSADDLEALVNHIYIKDMGYLEDLKDLEEETKSSSEE